MKRLAWALSLCSLCGCDSYLYHSARFLDATQRYGRAVEQYEAFLRREPSGPRAVLAHFRAGEIYARTFQRCPEARRHWEAAARMTPYGSPENEQAGQDLLSCPDYFPLDQGRSWTYGDSASGGRAMTLKWSAHGPAIAGELFAGKKRVRGTQARYERRGWMIWEIDGTRRRAILRYPFRKGESWTSGRGADEERFRIEDDDAQVRTKAGTFSGCLKVRDYRPGFSQSWAYDYYAPFVGKVKTTLAGPGFENPNTELLRYSD